MKFCSKCGKELLDEAVFCLGCGSEIKITESETESIIKAEEKYLNEYVWSQGYVSGIQSDKFWLYADEERDLNKYSHLVCFFNKSNKDLIKSISSLKNGDKIKVYGKIIKIEDSYPTDNLHMQIDKIEVIV